MVHKKEFTFCQETKKTIALNEVEKCEATGRIVAPGLLETCEITGRRVLSSQCDTCAVTGKRGLRTFFVTSSVSHAPILKEIAVRSARSQYCSQEEARPCAWSGTKFHPDDLETCTLTGLLIHRKYATDDGPYRLKVLVDLLEGLNHSADAMSEWAEAASRLGAVLDRSRCRIEAAVLSPDKNSLAISADVKTMFGLRAQKAGAVFLLSKRVIEGRAVKGKRDANSWYRIS
jgi:hypothetical protein